MEMNRKGVRALNAYESCRSGCMTEMKELVRSTAIDAMVNPAQGTCNLKEISGITK